MNQIRRSFGPFLSAATFTAVLLLSFPESARALSGPEAYVKTVAEKLVSTINAGGSVEAFENLVTRHADFRTIARFSLGKYRKKLPAGRENEYYELTKRHIAVLMRAHTKGFGKIKLRIVSSKARNADNILVKSNVTYGDGSSVPVSWRVVKRGGGYRIFDVIIKGVSMAVTLRTDFTSHISKNKGQVTALMARLRR